MNPLQLFCRTVCRGTSPSFEIPKQDLIAPSTNRLSVEAARASLEKSTHHCAAMSLQFLQLTQQEGSVETIAQKMSLGADLACARTSALYHQCFPKQSDLSGRQVHFNARKATAKHLGLEFSKSIEWKMRPEKMLSQFESLAPGSYLFSLPGHLCALIKQEDGQTVLYDPDRGTAHFKEEWMLPYLKSNRVGIAEEITLLKIGKPDGELSEVILSPEVAPRFEIHKPEARFGTSTFTLHDKIHKLVVDHKTGYVYNDNSKNLVRKKCAVLLFLTPLSIVARTICHVTRAIFHTLAALVHWKEGKRHFSKAYSAICDTLRTPIYGVAALGAAFFGLFKPFEARSMYGYLERDLNHQNQWVNFRLKQYIAPCFTPLNFNAETRDLSAPETIAALKRSLLKLEAFQESN